MHTTLDIDADVLLAAKDLARRQGKTAGEVLSDLARLGLQGGQRAAAEVTARYGFAPMPATGTPVTNGQIGALRESLGED